MTDDEPLVLTPPAVVALVDADQAVGAIPLDHAKRVELGDKAAAFIGELTHLDVRSPAFARKAESISSMGAGDLRAAAAVAGRLLDRPAAAMGQGGADAQTRVATALFDLRTTVTELDPKALTGAKRSWFRGGSPVDRYFARYQSLQAHLDSIITVLGTGQDELRKDNAVIETEKANMWTTMGKLAEYNELAAILDAALTARITELEAAGRSQDADVVRGEALFPVRQRRQDFMTQLAVNVQGYLALDLVRRNNIELIKGVDHAQSTTVVALRTAVLVAQALTRQKLVLDQISALNTVAADVVQSASGVADLQAAFDRVFATMDALDTFHAQAIDSMAQTVNALEGQLARAKRHLEREISG